MEERIGNPLRRGKKMEERIGNPEVKLKFHV